MDSAFDLSLDELAQRCAAETERFFQRAGAQDNGYCFELMRRAFVERDDAAWDKVYAQYQGLVTGWIVAHPQFAATDEESAYFLNAVFTSMWKSCTPERFSRFPDLPALLAYLKSCVHTNIANHLRKRRVPVATMHEESTDVMAAHGMAGGVLDKLARAELWQLLDTLLHNDKERLITDLYFIQGLKPRTIYEQAAAHFASIQEVYRVKQNLMERLSRNAELQQFCADLREND
ncbi:MAG: sigma-70 family RNA polymerase sigma factor [Caldilineaceae bacterium]|nr:sigma-70 family RNA polymerase sigma factor [Caldilineaceae bacterium]